MTVRPGQGVGDAPVQQLARLFVQELQAARGTGTGADILLPPDDGGIEQLGRIRKIYQSVHILVVGPGREMMDAGIPVQACIDLHGRFRLELLRRGNNHVQRPSQRDSLQAVVVLDQVVGGDLHAQVPGQAQPSQGTGFRSQAGSRVIVQPACDAEHAPIQAPLGHLAVQGPGCILPGIVHQR